MTSEDDHSLEAASQWVATLKRGAPDRSTRRALKAWLEQDPAHAAALDLMMRAWEQAGPEIAHPTPSARVADPRRSRAKSRPSSPWLWVPSGLAAACVALLVVVMPPPQTQTYQTAVGQMSRVRLADHSVVWLNTGSRLQVTLTPFARRLSLTAGEAEFQVAHEAWRPFVVTAPDVVVRATGTDFSVRQDAGGARVVLAQGWVKVWRPQLSEADAVALTAGDALSAPHAGAFSVAPTDTAAELAWRQGQLIFFDQPLSYVVAQFARYGGAQVRFASLESQKIRVSGAFRARDLTSFLRDLNRSQQVHSYTDENGEIVIR